MRVFSSLLRRILPACALLAIGGVLTMRGCRDEQGALQANTKPAPARLKERGDPRMEVAKWSQRFAGKKPPPVEFRPDVDTTPGQLDNGMHFLLCPQLEHPGEISLRMIVLVGSMHENESERGLAHFVEHLAFMGRRSRPEGHTLEVLQRLGLEAGADSNASTSRDHTLYEIDLPLADEAALEEAFRFLRDIADGLLFRPEDVESERRVILRELDERQESRAFDLQAAAILPKVPAAQLPPGGLKEVIEKVTSAQLRSFWQRNYLSSRMALAVVGDFEAEAMSARIKRHFDSLPKQDSPPDPAPGSPFDSHPLEVQVVPHRSDERVTLTIATPWWSQEPDQDSGVRRAGKIRSVAATMLAARLSRDAAERGALSSQVDDSHVELLRRLGWSELEMSCSPQSALTAFESLLRDFFAARDGGFEAREFAEAKGEWASKIRLKFLSRLSNGNLSQADLLADSFRTGRIVESPEDELNRSLSELASITREECEASLRSDWRDDLLRLLISGSVEEGMRESAAQALVRAASAPRTGPKSPGEIKTLRIESFGAPGVLSRQRLDEERGYLEAEFANGVMVRLKPMPSLGGMTLVKVHVGYGLMSLPADKPGLGLASMWTENWFPLEGYSQLDFRAALAESGLSSAYYPEPEYFTWSGESDRAALGRLLEVICGRIARPGVAGLSGGWQPGRHARGLVEELQKNRDDFDGKFERLLHSGDPRLYLPTTDALKRDTKQVADWLLPMLAGDRLCVLIAGDFEPEQALKQVAATFGALPSRQSWDSPSPYRPLIRPEPGRHLETEEGELDLATLGIALPLDPPQDASGEVLGKLLEGLVEIRVRTLLREKQGASYSPFAYRQTSPDRLQGWVIIESHAESGHSEAAADLVRGLLGEMQRGQWSGDEFVRATRPMEYQFRKAWRSPLLVLRSLSDPEKIPAPGGLEPGRLALLEPKLRELARLALDPEAALELRMEPVGAEENEGP